ncbi:MAG: hypothetical protein E5Y31_02320 [Mesorhizobium sp.]|nr:MAG: hypothetical protein E5Y31_02320 [Mesorhizobium sp.]
MHRLAIFAVIAAFIMQATPSWAAGRDPWVGEYGINCPKAQCRIEITHTRGKNYHLRFVAADRMNAAKVLCKADIPMVRGRLEFTPSEQYDDGLSGSYKSDPLVWAIRTVVDGSIQFFVNNTKCGRFNMMGEYAPIGD